MTLKKALKEGKSVAIIFVNIEEDKQYTIRITKESTLTDFFDAIAGELDFVTNEISDKAPVHYCKAIFITKNNPLEAEELDKSTPDGMA